MTTHLLTIDRPDTYFTVSCPCGFHKDAVCSYEAAKDAAKTHLGLPTEAPT